MSRFRKKSVLQLLFIAIFMPTSALAEVEMTGLNKKLENNTLLLLSLNKETCATPDWKIKKLFAQADTEIDRSLRALGYYHAQVQKNLTFKKDCWLAEFNINAGVPVHIKSVNIVIEGDGKNDVEFLKLQEKFQEKVAAPLQHSVYENMKTRLNALAQERGYLQAKWKEKKLRIDKKQNKAEIKLVLDSGTRQRFGNVVVKQGVLTPDLVNKYSAIVPGDYYGSDKLVETYEKLSKSGYFEQIDIHPDFDRAQAEHVPVDIRLTPKKKHYYSIGVGYGTDVGPLFNASYENRRLNEDGDTFSANLNASFVLSTLETLYSTPLDNPLTDSYTLGAGLKREKTDNFTSHSATLSNRLKHGLPDDWQQTLFADFSYEKFSSQQQNKNSILFVLGGSWLNTFSNNKLRPSDGHYLRFDVSGSYENPLSDVSFIRANAEAVWMKSLPWEDGIFTGRASLGAMSVSKFDNLPTSYRFYAGGINSVRGYEYKELGPKDALGNVTGGKFLGVVSAEYEHTVFDDWGIAAFVDAGNAFNLRNFELKMGAGVGLRWYSPIGPIRVDFAIPLNQGKSDYQIYFAAGARL